MFDALMRQRVFQNVTHIFPWPCEWGGCTFPNSMYYYTWKTVFILRRGPGSLIIGSSGVDLMTSSNGIIFRVTGPLWGETKGHLWIPSQKPVTRSFDVFFDVRLDK